MRAESSRKQPCDRPSKRRSEEQSVPAESRFDPRFAFDGATLQGTRDLLEARGDVEHGEAGRGAWLGDDQRQLTESMLTDARIVEHFAQIVERDANVLTRDLRQLLVGRAG